MKSLPDPKKISLSVAQAANWLGVASATLRRWDRSGRLVPERTSGNQRRYTLDQLKEFKRRKRAGTQDAPTVKQFPVAEVPKTVVGIDSVSSKVAASSRLSISFLALSLFLFVSFLIISNHPRFSRASEYFAGLFGQKDQAREHEERVGSDEPSQSVLQAATTGLKHLFRVHIPSEFDDSVSLLKGLSVNNIATLSGGIVTNNGDIDAGTGIVTAGNIPATIVSALTAGSGVSVSGTATNPTISNTGVLSLQSKTGALSLEAGSGISISGLKISSTVSSSTTSNSWEKIAVSGQTTLSAGSSTDTLTF
ncbi:MAG: MerR family transcriptional regulator, partial [Candidatus Levybacteria bacterium]|nr:MerR family transcriptional regulator [Candidatus Levybacteria bacterium]